MSYSAKYIDHFTNPRGVGEIDTPDARSEVQHEGGGCFDTIRLTLKLDNGRISEAMFRARACSGTIAACSALVAKVKGMEVELARTLTVENLIDELGGIPEKKQHSVELAIRALEAALNKVSE
jgi:NifU-like protein involved in Fe-S cluster formation